MSGAVVGACLFLLCVELCVLRVAPLRWRGRRLRSSWLWAVPVPCIDVGCPSGFVFGDGFVTLLAGVVAVISVRL